ncbi:MAG TPA: hypothetical protein VGR53_11515 [Nitrososphaerales archaeon]|nr:hypothetical protein [Nitrososphaerales archaeon]
MSDAFFQAVITASALFMSVGGLLTVNAMKEISLFEFRLHQVTRWHRFPGRVLMLWLFVGNVVLGILAIITSLLALVASSVGFVVSDSYVVDIFAIAVLESLLFAFSAGVNIGAVWRSGENR